MDEFTEFQVLESHSRIARSRRLLSSTTRYILLPADARLTMPADPEPQGHPAPDHHAIAASPGS